MKSQIFLPNSFSLVPPFEKMGGGRGEFTLISEIFLFLFAKRRIP
jgi:hypothetical protein